MSVKQVTAVIGLVIVLLLIAWGIELIGSPADVEAINSFEECAEAGYPIMESFPEQCATADGRVFTRELTEQEKEGMDEEFIENFEKNEGVKEAAPEELNPTDPYSPEEKPSF